jgi:hypothetical protein
MDKALIDAMAGARLNTPGGRRLVSSLYKSLKTTPDLGMTDAQRQWLSDLAYKHRRQIKESVRRHYPRIFEPSPPTLEEIAHLMTDDELSDALGAGAIDGDPDDGLDGVIVTVEPAAGADRAYSSPEQLEMSVILT